MGLAEGVAAGDERHRLLVVHRHAGEGLADVPRRSDRIGIAVRTFRVDVNQTHLHGSERIFEFPVAGVALVIQPFVLRAPVDVFFRLPDGFCRKVAFSRVLAVCKSLNFREPIFGFYP